MGIVIQELFEYQGIPEAVKTSVEQLEEDGFGSGRPGFHCLVVEEKESQVF